MNFVTYIPALGVDLGMQNEAPFLLTMISVADLVAKGIMSLVSDRGWCQRRYFAISAGVLASVTASRKTRPPVSPILVKKQKNK